MSISTIPADTISPFMTDAVSASLDRSWAEIKDAANVTIQREPFLKDFLNQRIASHSTFASALASVLAYPNQASIEQNQALYNLFAEVIGNDQEIAKDALADLRAVTRSDPAVTNIIQPFLFFKGYHAIQTHRIAHVLWKKGQQTTALFLQSRSSQIYGIDIHPNAKLGRGLVFDHGTGIVIGETAIVEDEVALFHGVTLGGTGHERQDRHPKVRKNALIGAGATLLGNIEIGEEARIGAGSVVLKNVPAFTTVAGAAAKPIHSIIAE